MQGWETEKKRGKLYQRPRHSTPAYGLMRAAAGNGPWEAALAGPGACVAKAN